MATSGTATTNTSNSGGSNAGVLRDVNASIGALDFLNNFGASTSSATTGAVTLGDKIIGGNKSDRQFGLVQTLAIIAGVVIVVKLWKGAE